MNKSDLVDRINEILNSSDLKIQPYRKYVTKSGKNVKFLLKILRKHHDDKYIELRDLLLKLSEK